MVLDVGRALLEFGVADVGRIRNDEIEGPSLLRAEGVEQGPLTNLDAVRVGVRRDVPIRKRDRLGHQFGGDHRRPRFQRNMIRRS